MGPVELGTERRALREVREPGPLAVSRDVQAALVRLLALEAGIAEASGEPAPSIRPVSLSVEAVDALEDFLRARLPDDALALFTSCASALASFDLALVGSRTEQAWALGARKSRVVLGLAGSRAVCIPRRPERGHPLRISLFDPEDRTETDAGTISAWLSSLGDSASERLLELDPLAEEPELDAPWTPKLARTLALPEPGSERAGRRVLHPRFGEGVVRRAIPETDKLEIDFGDAGVRVLVARFVTEVEPRR